MIGFWPVIILQWLGVLIPLSGIIILLKKGQGKENIYLVMTNIGAFLMNWGYLQLLKASDYREALTVYKFEYIGSVFFYMFFLLFLKSFFLKEKKIFLLNIAFALFITIELGSIGTMLSDNSFAMQNVNVLYHEDDGHIFSQRRTDSDFFIMPDVESLEEISDYNVPSISSKEILNRRRGYAFVTMDRGPFLLIRYSSLSLALLISLIASVLLAIKRKVKEERAKILHLICAQVVVLSSLLFHIFRSGVFDMTPILVSASVMAIICSTANGNFFTIADRGRGWVLDHSDIIFIIVDKEYRFLDANEYAKKICSALSDIPFCCPLPDGVQKTLFTDDSEIELEGRKFAKKIAEIEERGKVVGYSILLIDMTDHYNLMDELELERQKAIAANEAKSVFMSNMSHEIRTPMNAIVGMTEIMLRRKQSEENLEYLNNIKNSGNALLSVVNDILDFSKIEAGRLEIIPDDYEMMSVLNDLSMIFLNRIGDKPIELLYDIEPTLPVKLRGDSNRIRQVLLNIVNNGIKYTDEGHVKLSIHSEKLSDDEIILHCSVEDTGIGIKEEDIPKLFSNFTQVDTKKNRGKEGTGLGLSIAKQLVEAMEGRLWVESEYGVGSKFFFTMKQKIVDVSPATSIKSDEDIYVTGDMVYHENANMLRKLCECYEKVHYVEHIDMLNKVAERIDYVFVDREITLKTEVTPEIKAAVEVYNPEIIVIHNPMVENAGDDIAVSLNKPLYSLNFCLAINHEFQNYAQRHEMLMNYQAPEARVLIVDDNEMNRKVVEGLLEPLAMSVDMAFDGKQAVDMVQKNEYDIVFMDHMMPIMDGVEATQAIRKLDGERYQNMKIVALSANALLEAKEQFYAAGMDDFLAKPVKSKDLIKMVWKYLPKDKIVEISDKAEDVEPVELPTIEGLDVQAGVENSGGLKLFTSLLGDFYKLIDRKAVKIEKCMADGLIKDYTIEVHALKNTARMIGALELSEMFYKLELAGNNEDIDYIEEHTAETLDLLRSYKDILKGYSMENDDNKENLAVDEIRILVEKLRDAVDSFELDEADAAMKKLEGANIPEQIRDKVVDLGALVADVAMEDVLLMCNEILELL